MMCLYMGKLNGKKYCLMGMSNKEICDIYIRLKFGGLAGIIYYGMVEK